MNDNERSGWIFTDTTKSTDCPRCKVKAGEHCRTPKSRKTHTPHNERCMAFCEREERENPDYMKFYTGGTVERQSIIDRK